ncbi:hypothetical protein R1flu_008143 [Riccia fluitans]|uniref:Uncharacterized protein n=1 Tax=Riccia fluitans TaxID=41844 RepID=A0ABD1YB19_9MARC
MGIVTPERGDKYDKYKEQQYSQLKVDIHSVVGWENNSPPGVAVFVKMLKDRGIHTVIGIIAYCLKIKMKTTIASTRRTYRNSRKKMDVIAMSFMELQSARTSWSLLLQTF